MPKILLPPLLKVVFSNRKEFIPELGLTQFPVGLCIRENRQKAREVESPDKMSEKYSRPLLSQSPKDHGSNLEIGIVGEKKGAEIKRICKKKINKFL